MIKMRLEIYETQPWTEESYLARKNKKTKPEMRTRLTALSRGELSYSDPLNDDEVCLGVLKHFVVQSKRRSDYLIVSQSAPGIAETLFRINRALLWGQTKIATSRVSIGAQTIADLSTTHQARGQSPIGQDLMIKTPITLDSLSHTFRKLDAKNAEHIYWLRVVNQYFELYAANPDLIPGGDLSVYIKTDPSEETSPDLNSLEWNYADLLLNPSDRFEPDTPSVLGDLAVRAALSGLKPGYLGEVDLRREFKVIQTSQSVD